MALHEKITIFSRFFSCKRRPTTHSTVSLGFCVLKYFLITTHNQAKHTLGGSVVFLLIVSLYQHHPRFFLAMIYHKETNLIQHLRSSPTPIPPPTAEQRLRHTRNSLPTQFLYFPSYFIHHPVMIVGALIVEFLLRHNGRVDKLVNDGIEGPDPVLFQ